MTSRDTAEFAAGLSLIRNAHCRRNAHVFYWWMIFILPEAHVDAAAPMPETKQRGMYRCMWQRLQSGDKKLFLHGDLCYTRHKVYQM